MTNDQPQKSTDKHINLNEEKEYQVKVSAKSLKWWGAIAASSLTGLIIAVLWINKVNQNVEEFRVYKEKLEQEEKMRDEDVKHQSREAAKHYLQEVISAEVTLNCDSINKKIYDLQKLKELQKCEN